MSLQFLLSSVILRLIGYKLLLKICKLLLISEDHIIVIRLRGIHSLTLHTAKPILTPALRSFAVISEADTANWICWMP